MGYGWKINNQAGIHFVTFQVRGWVDLFSRKEYKEVIVDQFNFYREKKMLKVYAYVIMTNHVHAILSATNPEVDSLSSLIGRIKQFTAKSLIAKMISEGESRRAWMLDLFSKNSGYSIWTNYNKPMELYSSFRIHQKLNYIHQNPVKEGWVKQPEEYLFSSAKNYCGLNGVMPVDLLY